MKKNYSRRNFIKQTSLADLGLGLTTGVTLPLIANPKISHPANRYPEETEPIIDIHQHTNYSGRTDDQLLTHQRAMGITITILLPSGRPLS